jgi:outer membrane protein assembly factor BamB
MFDVAAGSVVTSADVSFMGFTNGMNTSPVSDGTSVYIISPPSLYAFSPSLGAPLWTASGAYSSQPAIANGVLYSISGGQLQANDAATGAALWSFVGDKALTYPPVVAAGYVYVASDINAYAVDTANHTQAWTAKPGGWLSIAAGRLLVASNNGTVVAWSLTP